MTFPAFRPALLTLAIAVALIGCDSTSTADTTPAPIAAAAFDLGADTFPSDNGRAGASAGANYTNAAIRVGIVTTVVGLSLALPSAATHAVTRDTPEVVDGVWIWATQENVLGTPVALRLEGTPDGGEIDWRLTAQQVGAGADAPFTYYTATTSLDGKTGSWRLFDPNQTGAVLRADFDVRAGDDQEVTFAVPKGRENGGTSVRYATNGSTHTFDFVSQPQDERALIQWSETTRAGSITADGFNGGATACWNASLANVSC